MPRWTSPLALLLALPLGGCLSAETSEASQLSRLSHGIDESSTTLDRFNAPGDAAPPKAPVATAPPPMIVVAPPPDRSPADPAPGEGTDDTQPRPTIRVYGTPSAHAKGAPGGSVASIVYSDAGPTPATPAK
jgi:hypothetical protein